MMFARSKPRSALLLGAFVLTVSGGVAFAYGEVGYIHTDGTVRKSQRDGTQIEAVTQVICISTAVADGAAGLFHGPGRIPGLSGGTGGSLAVVSATAGVITVTLPAQDSGFYLTRLGIWATPTILLFAPEQPIGPM